MNGRHIESFLRCAQSGSFTSAARSLYISPNALIEQINLLEKDLGCRLFDRTNRGIRLTGEGAAFYEGVSAIMREYDRLVCRVRSMGSAPVALKTTLPPGGRFSLAKMSEVVARHGREVSLGYVRVGTSWTDALLAGEIDFFVLPESAGYRDRGLLVEPLMRVQPRCVVSPGSPLARLEAVTPDDLQGREVLIDTSEYLEAYPFLKRFRSQVSYVRSTTDVYVMCNAGAAYLIPDPWASMYTSLVSAPMCGTDELQYVLVARNNTPEHVVEILRELGTCVGKA